MLSAGQRNNRVRFERRPAQDDDGFGNTLGPWDEVVTCWAGFRPQFGRERLAAGALESGLTGTLTVLRFTATAGLTEADRAIFAAGPYAGRTCQIRSVVPTPDNREIELLLEEAAT